MLICVHEVQRIRNYLLQDPGRYLYELGDLEPWFWRHTQWFAWELHDEIQALILIYHGDRIPVMLNMSPDSPAMHALLEALPTRLPGKFYAHVLAEHTAELKVHWQMLGGERYQRMVLKHPENCLNSFETLKSNHCIKQVPPEAANTLQAFYRQSYPDNWFNSRMLKTDAYFAILSEELPWEKLDSEAILAVAGVHVVSFQERIAALGNIAVAPAARGQKLGTLITAAVSQHLLKSDIQTLGLNVHVDNQAAISCYTHLGYRFHHEYQEWTLTQA